MLRKHRFMLAFFGLLVAGFLVRLYLSQFWTYRNDFGTWQQWASGVAREGFGRFYATHWSDYLPGYLYILWCLQVIGMTFPSLPAEILFKFPANISDLLIAVMIFFILRSVAGRGRAALASSLYFFNPASLANSTFWGQADAVHAVALLAAVAAGVRGSFLLSGAAAGAAFMIKPQSIVILPLIFLLAVLSFFFSRGKDGGIVRRARPLIGFAVGLAATVVLMGAPFMPEKTSGAGIVPAALSFARERFEVAYNQYKAASLNAFNLWGIFAMWKEDSTQFIGVSYRTWGTLLFGAAFVAIVYGLWNKLRKDPQKMGSASWRLLVFEAVGLILFALFLFVTRAHERHLLPAIAFLTFSVLRSRTHFISYALLSLLYVLNLFYAYMYLAIQKGEQLAPAVVSFTQWLGANVWIPALAAFIVFVWFFWTFIRETRSSSRESAV